MSDDYPRMLYRTDGATRVIETPEEQEQLLQHGWDTMPSEVHQRPPPTQAPAMNAGDPMGVMIRQILNEVLDERGIGVKSTRYTGPRR